MKLNKMQQVASNMFQEWYKNPNKRQRKWFEISGAAGTGKTTVVKHIIQSLNLSDEEVLFVAFVGKAALALRLSGVDGRTIHSILYNYVEVPRCDKDGNVIYKINGAPETHRVFNKVSSLPEKVKLVVVDEGGMVDRNIGRDLLSYDIPLLVLGDLNQLPPVIGNNLFLSKPDVILNEIMRQHKDSAIIYLSQLAIHGIHIPFGPYNDGECEVIRANQLTNDHLRAADLVICATNKTRDLLNWYMRKDVFGIDSTKIEVGDKLICRQNNWDIILDDDDLKIDIALVNGLIGYVSATDKNNLSGKANMNIDFKPEFSNMSFTNIPINSNMVLSSYEDRQSEPKLKNYTSFELGYCTTCHLAQGSQYPYIIVYVDGTVTMSSYFCKWLYTAITRARSKLTIVF